MILREVSMQIKLMSRDGRPKAAIARQFGVSRRTVSTHRKRSGPFPEARAPRRSKLERCKAYIRARLESFDLPATVLYRELRGQGYTGGLTILRAFVRPLKRELVRRVTERLETRPGRQAQNEWGESGTTEVEGVRRKLYHYDQMLVYSRMKYTT